MTTKPWQIKQGMGSFGDTKSLSFDLEGHEDLLKRLKSVANGVTKQLNIVANNTAKFAKSQIAKEINSQVMITQAEIKKALRAKRLSSTRREIILKYDRRWPLDRFKPRQTKKGVSYRIERGGVLKKLPHAFIIHKWGSVWIREDANDKKGQIKRRQEKRRKGTKIGRSPIRKVYAVSPWGVAVKKHLFKRIAKDTSLRMRKEMRERIRVIIQGFVK